MFDDVHYTAQLFCGPYVRIVTCIAQVNMQAYWDLPKPSNYSHDVLVSGICFKSSRVLPLPATTVTRYEECCYFFQLWEHAYNTVSRHEKNSTWPKTK